MDFHTKFSLGDEVIFLSKDGVANKGMVRWVHAHAKDDYFRIHYEITGTSLTDDGQDVDEERVFGNKDDLLAYILKNIEQ